MKLTEIKQDSIEAIICFALYICAQDKIISDEEYLSLGKKLTSIVDSDVIVQKVRRTDLKVLISKISGLILKNKFTNKKMEVVEKGYFESLFKSNEYKDLALRTARIAASSDGFHRLEKAKFNFWADLYLNE